MSWHQNLTTSHTALFVNKEKMVTTSIFKYLLTKPWGFHIGNTAQPWEAVEKCIYPFLLKTHNPWFRNHTDSESNGYLYSMTEKDVHDILNLKRLQNNIHCIFVKGAHLHIFVYAHKNETVSALLIMFLSVIFNPSLTSDNQ